MSVSRKKLWLLGQLFSVNYNSPSCCRQIAIFYDERLAGRKGSFNTFVTPTAHAQLFYFNEFEVCNVKLNFLFQTWICLTLIRTSLYSSNWSTTTMPRVFCICKLTTNLKSSVIDTLNHTPLSFKLIPSMHHI